MYVANFLQVKTMHFSHPELDTQRLTITVPVAAYALKSGFNEFLILFLLSLNWSKLLILKCRNEQHIAKI